MKNILSQKIEALLFAFSEPQSIKQLSNRLETNEEDIREGLRELAGQLENSGIMLVISDDSATLATRPEHSELIEAIRKEELQKELSKASAETLAIIAYHSETSKAQIEFIRGVNSSYSLRALQIRGLIEQKGSGRSITYVPTLAMLEHFGVPRVVELPNFAETKQKIDTLLNRKVEQDVPEEKVSNQEEA